MKLVFPNGEHAQVEIGPGITTIGSDPDADVCLDNESIAGLHAKIQVDEKGTHIAVENAANITRVNGSLVVARTAIKGGDALLFNSIQCQVVGKGGAQEPAREAPKPSRDRSHDEGMTVVRQALPQFLLRGVSGSTFGKHFPIFGSMVVGRHSECDICLPSDEISRKHAKLVVTPEGLFVEDLGSANGTFVNGVRVRRERVEPGDELKLDTVRFLVQSPGKETPSKMEGKKVEESGEPEASERESSSAGAKVAIIVTVLIVLAVVGMKVAGVF